MKEEREKRRGGRMTGERGDGSVLERGARARSSLVAQRHNSLCFDRALLRRDYQNQRHAKVRRSQVQMLMSLNVQVTEGRRKVGEMGEFQVTHKRSAPRPINAATIILKLKATYTSLTCSLPHFPIPRFPRQSCFRRKNRSSSKRCPLK